MAVDRAEDVAFTLNSRAVSVPSGPRTCRLLHVLREDLGLMATRFGCGQATCGACTVIVDGRAVMSCDLPLSAVAGATVETAESLDTAPPIRSSTPSSTIRPGSAAIAFPASSCRRRRCSMPNPTRSGEHRPGAGRQPVPMRHPRAHPRRRRGCGAPDGGRVGVGPRIPRRSPMRRSCATGYASTRQGGS